MFVFRGGETPAIEIWNVVRAPFLQKILYELENNDDKPSVESLIWIKDRLFSCGLHGFIVEHDLNTRKIKVRSYRLHYIVYLIDIYTKNH